MGVSKGRPSLSIEEVLSRVSEAQILARYLGVTQIPCFISSPFRQEEHPSFRLFSPDGKKIRYIDFGTGENGTLLELLSKMWHLSFTQTLVYIYDNTAKDLKPAIIDTVEERVRSLETIKDSKLEIKVRAWTKKDREYWQSYGVPIEFLEKACVYPISHYFITKGNNKMTFVADPLAYAFVEFKEKNLTIKVYQPYNKKFKWMSKHDRSVIGLWRLMPAKGGEICICSSVKDALCLTANTGIPAVCLQGEGYGISKTAQNVLKQRFEKVYIFFDNDVPGKRDAKKLQLETGFINIELPEFEGGKDISDFYKATNNPDVFKSTILNLFKYDTK